jgi:hypothetical protein
MSLQTPACNTSATEYIDKMFRALAELSTLTDQYRGLLAESVNKSADFHELYAKVLLEEKAGEGKVTVDELKAKVTARVAASERAADIADALVKATREALELRKETIDACQSALAYSRAELERTPNAEPPSMIREKAWPE